MRRKLRIKGFTLVELILYVAIVGVFVTGAISFSWNIIYAREKAYQQQIVGQSARIAMARITYEIRRAKSVQSVSDTQIVLNNTGSTTTISLNGAALEITTGGAGPYALTSKQVIVDSANPIFTDLGSSNNNSNSVGVSLTLRQSRPEDSFKVTAETTLTESVELNSQFNESRGMLVDLSSASLVGSTDLQGITITNTSSADITIDKMVLSWTGTAGGENVTTVQIDSGGVEWSGSEVSGATLELTDYVLTPAAGVVNVDSIAFDSSMSGADLELSFVMLDGSANKSNITIVAGTSSPTPTPTPTPTPSPPPSINSCAEYCTTNSYTTGTCRKKTADCTSNGETYESGGDPWCSPPNTKCCCL